MPCRTDRHPTAITTTIMDAMDIITTIPTTIEIIMGGMTIVEMEGEKIIVVVFVGDTILRRMEATEGEAVASMASAVEGVAEDDHHTSLVLRTTTMIGIEEEGRSANPMIAEEGTMIEDDIPEGRA